MRTYIAFAIRQHLSFLLSFYLVCLGIKAQRKNSIRVLGEQVAADFDYAMTPRIDLLLHENPTAWIYARLTIQHFGERFRFRTDTYVGKCLLWFA